MSKKAITNDTIITIGKSISIGAYMKFFTEELGKEMFPDFHEWLKDQAGKTIEEASALYDEAARLKSMEEKLQEERFHFISEPDKAFIAAFDKVIGDLGFDYGGGIGSGYGWGKYMIIYGKTGTKNRACPARIYIKESGEVRLRLFFNKIDKHQKYIEEAPPHIKAAFANDWGGCTDCSPTCKMVKEYSIDGKQYRKCCHSTAYFSGPTVEKLPDYMALYAEFNPVKRPKVI